MFACEYSELSLLSFIFILDIANVIRSCGQDEEHDPGEEFEEPLTCAVCGDHCKFCRVGLGSGPPKSLTNGSTGHRQCAREQQLLRDDEGKFIAFTSS